jgi:PadR family transcriptional regulator, regulatory protein PadR
MHSKEPRITGPTLKVLKELLAQPLEELSGAQIARSAGLASGTLYPILFRLEEAGWLISHWEEVEPSEVKRPRRRLYHMTPLGERAAVSAFREHMPMVGEFGWQL